MPDTPAAANMDGDRSAKLAAIKDRSAERQLLDASTTTASKPNSSSPRFTTKWSAQVLRQHRILLHLILQSRRAGSLFILICMVLGDALVRRLMSHPALDRRQAQTLRMVLELAVQVVGALLILLLCLRRASRNAHHPRPRHRRPHHRTAGFRSRVFRLVCPHGQERHSHRRLG